MPEHLIVLGGGIGALSTVFALTQEPGWRDRMSITVYQPGWRLGGKAASGVDLENNGRCEEHGLHVWFGFYQNAFRMMRECYDALDRPAGHPIPTATEAFTPIHDHTFLEEVGDRWMPWSYHFGGDGELPGAPAARGRPETLPMYPGVWGTTHRLLSWIRLVLREHPRLSVLRSDTSVLPTSPPWRRSGASTLGGTVIVDRLLTLLKRAAAGAPTRPAVALVDLLRRSIRVALESDPDPGVQRLRIMADLSLTGLRGMLADEVCRHGYRSIDGLDFRDWLRSHGAAPDAVDAPIVRTLYDIFFAYEAGDVNRPSVAAGATLRGMFRLLFSYHGAVLWKMNAGMGDAIIAPLYELLRDRGVRFEFFHRATALRIDGGAVTRIELARQLELVSGPYEPLLEQKGLMCWPNRPLWQQVQTPNPPTPAELERPCGGTPVALEQGRDFDRVLLAIPLGGLPAVCGDLVEADDRWRQMLAHLGTVRTQALQLWFEPSYEDLGAPWPSGMLASYAQPFSSWSDFTQVLEREDWPAKGPRYLAYSCGVLPDEPSGPSPDEALETVQDTAKSWLDAYGPPIWPNARTAAGGFDWSTLYGPDGGEGPARLRAQYLRANTHPSERYVLALPGTTQYRIRPGQSGFDNLVLAGSWTDNDYTLSCIEATVMSGLMAARALDGIARVIVGEGDV